MSNLNKTNQLFGFPEDIVNNIFGDSLSFNEKAVAIFLFQYNNNKIYRLWCDALHIAADKIKQVADIPFLPVSFFKTHQVCTGEFEPLAIFESSGTTGKSSSKHFVKDLFLYQNSFLKTFELFYGDVKDWRIIGLLPSYLERKNSSLVMMVDELIRQSKNNESGFYLNELDKLHELLTQNEAIEKKTMLIGVTFALLDFAEKYPISLQQTVVMETGGMKGRRKELTRQEVHGILKTGFDIQAVHSEYGMTEMLSQAYSKANGDFICPPWMKVLVRNLDDPLCVKNKGKGILNVIDLANIYSCAFIASDDIGIVKEDGSFEVQGRIDNSDIRGCNLLVV